MERASTVPEDATHGSAAQRAVRLLLINPGPPESFWSFRWAMDRILAPKRAPNPPLGLATLAALCPADWRVRIVDEAVEPVPADPEADMVGVCGMGVQHERQRELLAHYRERGCFTVAGGSFASLCPERFEGVADCVVVGEAERIWPRFCRDFAAGRPAPIYRETGSIDLAETPTPRFDLLDLSRYGSATLQFSRGCPYRCEFCDIIVMFGRRPRTKAPAQIERELDALRAQGVGRVFFVDDNLIGDRRAAKALLDCLCGYQRRHGYPFAFGTEASLNLADDPQLLALFREAGFGWVFLGIETPDVESLRAAGKTQNTRSDLLAAVRKIYAHGIDVFAGFIVGFDGDTTAAFEQQRRFIEEAGIQVAMVGLLTALPATPLYVRLERAGRLRPGVAPGDNTRARTNVIPAGMSYDEMISGYKTLYRRLCADRSIALRIRRKTRFLRRPVRAGSPARTGRSAVQLLRVLRHGILPGGIARIARFAGTLATPPRLWPQVVADWATGLSMRAYTDRYFPETVGATWARAREALEPLRRRFGGAFRAGRVAARIVPEDGIPRLVLTVRGPVERSFLRAARRRFTRMLRDPRASLTLRVERGSERRWAAIVRLLQRLERYGDRVSLRIDAALRERVETGKLRIGVVLEPAGPAGGG